MGIVFIYFSGFVVVLFAFLGILYPNVLRIIYCQLCMQLHKYEEFFLFCTMTNKCTIISQIITLLHILSCHPQVACNQYFAKLHKHFKCNCW
jgi:hypothetical protein